MSSLLEGGKPRFYDDMIYMKDDEKLRIRVLPNIIARKIFIHSCKDIGNRFLDVLCVGLKNSCKFCQTNMINPKYREIKENQLKPYPGRTRFVAPVYVYDKSKVLLLGGKEVWQQIDTANAMFGSVLDRDVIIMRKKTDRVTYIAQADAPTEFKVSLDPTKFPKVDDYIKWLTNNIEDAVMLEDDANITAAIPASPQPSAPVADKASKQDRLDQITDMLMQQKLDQAVVKGIMQEVAPTKAKFGEFTEDELKQFQEKYQAASKSGK